MRGYRILLFLGVIEICSFQCATSRKLEYNFPTDLKKQELESLKKRVSIGGKMFKKYCSQCHGIFGKVKDTTVKFTQMQIDTYSASFLKGDYKNHAFAQNLTKEQLTDILLFAYLVKKK